MDLRVLAAPMAGLAERMRRPFASRRSVASGALVVSVLAAWLVAVFLQDGYVADTYDLADSYVWVTEIDTAIGRVNAEVREQDWVDETVGAGVDVRQDGIAVFVHSDDGSEGDGSAWQRLDPAQLQRLPLPFAEGATQLEVGGGTLAVLNAEGAVFTTYTDDLAALEATTDTRAGAPAGSEAESGAQAQERYEAGAGAAIAVGRGGDVAVLDAAAEKLVLLHSDGSEPVVAEVEAELDTNDVAREVALVGSRPVALVGSDLVLPDGSVVELDGDGLHLQQPGDSSSSVLLGSATGLLEVDLETAQVTSIETSGGEAVRPVRVAGVTAGAWAGDEPKLYWHAGREDAVTLDVDGAQDHSLRFRVNRDNVWLNDLSTGAAYTVIDGRIVITNQPSIEDDVTTTSSSTPETTRTDPPEENEAPVANPDPDFGARPLLPAIVHPLHNDVDPNEDPLTIELIEDSINGGTAELVDAGRAVQVTPDEGADRVTFDYVAFDGHEADGRSEEAEVTVTVASDGNRPPEPREDADGDPVESKLMVGGGSTARYDVLRDWYDPDGDPIYLADAQLADDSAVVAFRDSGMLTYTDTASVAATRSVGVTVADAPLVSEIPESAEGAVEVEVVTDNSPPDPRADHVTTSVGVPVEIEPLLNDVDPDGDEMTFELAEVPAEFEPVVEDRGDGKVRVSPEKSGTIPLRYVVSDGVHKVSGRIRVDVVDDDDPASITAGVDLVVLPYATGERPAERTVDLLANDHSPSGGVLTVVSVQTPSPGSGLSARLLQHRRLQVRSGVNLTTPQVLTYELGSGSATATGYVVVVSSPSAQDLEPVTGDDRVVVRSGDVVSVPVLANDFDPEGAELHLGTELTGGSDRGGTAWVSGSRVRFLAPEIPEDTNFEVELGYQVFDRPGPDFTDARQATGALRVQVVNPSAANRAPEPRPVEARVLAGRRVRITIPTSGIDPDGDSVRLLGLGRSDGVPSTPKLGRIVSVDADAITYEAFEAPSGGTDRFLYEVIDSGGPSGEPERATGVVRVGVAVDRENVNRPPNAVEDRYEVAPGGSIVVNPLSNDWDPEGDSIGYDGDGAFALASGAPEPERTESGVRLSAPDGAVAGTSYVIGYRITDSAGNRATGTITVAVRDDPEGMPPIARDDLARLPIGHDGSAVAVPVLENDDDPDGDVSKLAIDGAEGPTLEVTPAGRTRIVPYRIVDEQGLDARAVVRVPPAGDDVDEPPVWNASGVCSAEFQVNPATAGEASRTAGITFAGAGDPLTVGLADCGITDPEGQPVRLLDATSIGTSRRLAAAPTRDLGGFTITDPGGGAAPYVDVVTVAVTDAPVGQVGEVSVIQIPVSVTSEVDQPPRWRPLRAVTVTRDGDTVELDLVDFVADDADDPALLEFSLEKRDVDAAAGRGVTAELNGSVLAVTGSKRSPIGAAIARLGVAVSDGGTEGRPVSDAVVVDGEFTAQPLPSLRAIPPVTAELGELARVEVLEGATIPYGDDLEVGGVSAPAGSGKVGVENDGARGWVEFTPAREGRTTVSFRVTDEANRVIPGRVTFVVPVAPGRPGKPSVTASGDDSVTLRWAESTDNGSPVTRYEVTTRGSDSAGTVEACGTEPTCEINGLSLGGTYRFTVLAESAAGPSDPSPPSDPYTLDRCPSAPRNVSLAFDPERSPDEGGVLVARWSAPERSGGSELTGYRISVSPSGFEEQVGPRETELELPLGPAANGVTQRMSVSAGNGCDGQWGEAAASTAATPAGVPDPPIDVQAVEASNPGGGRLELSWVAPTRGGNPRDNGSAVTGYTIAEQGGAMEDASISVGDAAVGADGRVRFTLQVDTTNSGQRFQVRARNAAGPSDWSQPSDATTGAPAGPLTSLTASPSMPNSNVGLDGRIQLAIGEPTSGGPVLGYQYSRNGGNIWTNLGADRMVGGLTNGAEYTITVRAVAAGGAGDARRIDITQENGLASYGQPPPPMVESEWIPASHGGLVFSWSVEGDNGRPLVRTEGRLDGGEWSEFGLSGGGINVEWPQGSHSVQVRSVDDRGQVSQVVETPGFLPRIDINEDGNVDCTDLDLLIAAFRQTGLDLPEDVNGDGSVDIFDLSILVSQLDPQTQECEANP